MKNIYIPDIYSKDIYSINYTKLKKQNIKCLLFDLDNTIAPEHIKEPTKEMINHFQKLEEMGFKVIIISNALKNRVKPFKEKLNIDACHTACKPLPHKYKKIMELYNLEPENIAAIGDQIYTDIKGANKLDITSILVNPLSNRESIITKINRLKEKRLFKKFQKQKTLIKGEYYE